MFDTTRCPWAKGDLYIAYHDQEWGRPLHDDQRLFEMLNLEGAQAGLSWLTILKKREGYRRAFDRFNPEKIARYDESKIALLMADASIVRHRLKIMAVIANARACLNIKKEFASLDAYLWSFVDHRPIVNHWTDIRQVPCVSEQATAMSRDLVKRGFKFVGPKISYAFMQAVGMVNDHLLACPCRIVPVR